MFADVYPLKRLPRSLGPFTYRVPAESLPTDASITGLWVRVPFRGRDTDGIVWETRTSPPKNLRRISNIHGFLQAPRVTVEQWALIEFLSEQTFTSHALALWAMFPERPARPRSSTAAPPSTDQYHYTIGRERRDAIRSVVQKTEKRGSRIFLSLGPLSERLAFLLTLMSTTGKTGQSLIVVPTHQEGALIQSVLAKHFGDRVLFLSSELSRSNLWHAWSAAATRHDAILLTTKTGLLAPFSSVRVVVCDLASDPNHRQEDQNPRYDAQALASRLAQLHHVPIFFLDAQAPLALWHDARIEKVTLPEKTVRRSCADLSQKRIDPIPFVSDEMKKLLTDTDRSVLVFFNRRGSARVFLCSDCGWSLQCSRCKIPMTPHENTVLFCHRCNARQTVPSLCPSCRGTRLLMKGFGIDRLADVLKKTFPSRRVVLIDKDRSDAFRSGDIVVATEKILHMVIAPKTFSALIVANLDGLLQYPDFRTAERSYLLVERLCAVVGKTTPVLIQTFHPQQSIVRSIISGSPQAFYTEEIALRKALDLPPIRTVLRVIGVAPTLQAIESQARDVLGILSPALGSRVRIVGPSIPAVERPGRGHHRYFTIHILSDEHVPDTLRTVLTQLPPNWLVDVHPATFS